MDRGAFGKLKKPPSGKYQIENDADLMKLVEDKGEALFERAKNGSGKQNRKAD